jgi:hypothetical protein
MRDHVKERTKQLCEAIASEQDGIRFMELISELNRLLQDNEDALLKARDLNRVADENFAES